MIATVARLRRMLQLKLLFRRRGTVRLLGAWILLMMALHVVAMMRLEGMSLADAAWLTVVTATTVGYGDVSAKTGAGRLATVLLLFFGTIFVLATVASLLFDRAAERRTLKSRGLFRWGLKMHLLIVSTTGREPLKYLSRVVRQLRQDDRFRDQPVQILTHAFDTSGLPPELQALGVVHFSGDGDSEGELLAAGLRDASQVVVLADPSEPKADAYVYDVVSRIREAGYTGPVVAECVEDRNRVRLCTGPGDVALRPIRGFPEYLARAVLAPGTERLIEELLSSEGDECIAVTFAPPVTRPWRDVVMRVLDAGGGTVLGYSHSGEVRASPAATDTILFDTLFVAVPGHAERSAIAAVRATLA